MSNLSLEEWRRQAEALQRQKNEQFLELRKMKALVKVLIKFIFTEPLQWDEDDV